MPSVVTARAELCFEKLWRTQSACRHSLDFRSRIVIQDTEEPNWTDDGSPKVWAEMSDDEYIRASVQR